jgi:hypothetical protein
VGGVIAMLDTMLFEWSRHHGSSGFDATETSLSHREQARWSDRLLPLVSLPPGHHDTGSTCYLHYEDAAALLHRWPARDGLGRESTRTRALIGPPELLTFATAVALRTDVEPERGPEGPLPQLPEAWRRACEPEEALLTAADQSIEELTTLVAALIEARGEGRYTIVAPQQRRRALLWAAHRCYAHEPTAPWTFSTAESSGAGEHLPRFVFVEAGGARNSWVDDRVRVDVTRKGAVPAALYNEAALWVEEGLRTTVPARPATRPRKKTAPATTPAAVDVAAPPLPPPPTPIPAPTPPPNRTPAQPPPPPLPRSANPDQAPGAISDRYATAEAVPASLAERADYPLLVLGLTIVSALFVLFLMWAGSW